MYEIYAQVIINNNSKSTDRVYNYGIEPKFLDKIEIGKRVKVTFSNNKHILDAVVISLADKCDIETSKIKPIKDIIDEKPIITKHMIQLSLWIRERYICKYSDVIRLLVPAMIKYEHKILIKIINHGFCEISLNEKENEILELLKQGIVELEKLRKTYKYNDLYMIIDSLKEKNVIEIENKELSYRKTAYKKMISLKYRNRSLDEFNIRQTLKQKKVIEFLQNNDKININVLSDKLDVSMSIINNLIEKDILKYEMILDDNTHEEDNLIVNKLSLNYEQMNALNDIVSSNKNIFLLHGVTGSGKTEVYMNIIEHYRKQQKQSIMLVPEISLTAQTMERFKKRFGNKIAVFHSRLNKKEKFIEWNKVFTGEADVIVGARSALFAPIKNLGAIIIDEEHEDSYKSSTSPKYDTVEVAIKLSMITGAKVVLGTATPSLRTYNMVLKKQIELVEIKNRVENAVMPDIKIIDMVKELDKGNNTIISELLYESIRTSLIKKEQVILFLNKRGYSGFISCKKCGHVFKCEKCDVSMTYHIKGNKLRCHYCGAIKILPKTCPKCNSEKIEQFGAGTQHVEKLITHLFKNAVIERMDFDSMTGKGSYEKIYNDFKNRKIDILIGTQMLAKGFDFPDVTTVGILSADAILNLPFFNASEKTFQLLTQVSGRAGRKDKKGHVFIQTFEPESFIIKASQQNDYNLFVNEELRLRKEFAFPPFINIINICLISRDEEWVNKVSYEKYEIIKESVEDMVLERSLLLYKPTPHNIYKINNEYRINLFIKVSNKSIKGLKDILRRVYMEKDIKDIKVSININTDSV